MKLTTQAKVKALLVGSEDLDDDALALIDSLIVAVSKRAATFCNRQFSREERLEYHDGGGQFIYLKNLPVSELAKIRYSYSWDWGTDIPDTSYVLLDPEAGMVGYKGGLWPPGEKVLEVTYTAGYDEDPGGEQPPEGYLPIPEDLEQAVCVQVSFEYRRKNDPGLQAVSLPDGSITKLQIGEWLEAVEETLKRYRLEPM